MRLTTTSTTAALILGLVLGGGVPAGATTAAQPDQRPVLDNHVVARAVGWGGTVRRSVDPEDTMVRVRSCDKGTTARVHGVTARYTAGWGGKAASVDITDVRARSKAQAKRIMKGERRRAACDEIFIFGEAQGSSPLHSARLDDNAVGYVTTGRSGTYGTVVQRSGRRLVRVTVEYRERVVPRIAAVLLNKTLDLR